jgi:predicted PurR-regulated permease PerM
VTKFRAEGSGYLIGLLPDFLQDYWQRAHAYIDQSAFLSKFDFEQFMLSNIDAVSSMIANFGAAAARNILIGIVNLLLILVLMFFCFRDGERFLHWLYEIVPLPTDHVESVASRIYQTVTAVIRGALLTAGAQGALALIGYLVAGVPLAVFFGVVTGIAAMIPVVGAGLIWAPIGIFIFTQSPGWGIFIFIWGFFVVSMVDNLLKPILIGSRARMPILLIFCGIIGGVNVYGVTGVIIGPILIAVLLAFITIYREHYLSGFSRQRAVTQQQEPTPASE